MTKVIVATTINPPTEAIRRFDAMKDWTLVVAGDLKTPEYKLDRGIYFSPEQQEKYDKELSDLIGFNCIQRRNFAFLYAMKEMKADIVATVDDDNTPYDWWGNSPLETLSTIMFETDEEIFDPLFVTNRPDLWHRGFPLELVGSRSVKSPAGVIKNQFDIEAGLWNGEPDIDAVRRSAGNCSGVMFECPPRFASNKPSPFNSQNTIISAKVMPHYFMFPGIGRMDDIWASYYVQALGFSVCYTAQTVWQSRNPHSLANDARAEQLGIAANLNVVMGLKQNPDRIHYYLPPRSSEAFRLYQNHYE